MRSAALDSQGYHRRRAPRGTAQDCAPARPRVITVVMDIVAHGLWAAAAAITVNRKANVRVHVGWAVWWAAFPDVLAFGLPAAAGLWVRLVGDEASAGGHGLPYVRIGLPLYPTGHSFLVFLLVFGITTLLARRIVFELLGWLSHILIDIPTHSFSYYATRFLWPVSDYRVNGIPWWTPWLWAATYGALAVVYFLLWKEGWMAAARTAEKASGQECDLEER